MRIVLVAPEIPQNTGNVGRLCAGHDVELHLVEPLGFSLDDRYLKRAGLDYWPHIRLTVHPSFDDVIAQFPRSPVWCFSARATRTFWDVTYGPDDLLVFGRESTGLPAEVLDRYPERQLSIPHGPNIRSLNMANAVSVALYEVVRQSR
jgi:tRNA (cytidine/uridine-2'-O-)-methyltransferase